MAKKLKTAPAVPARSDGLAKLRRQNGCGPVSLGTDKALYERHPLFDDVVSPAAAGPRERFEAVARSVRDVLSQRWVVTEETYLRENPKRVYYLSMEFLLGPSLANNITNLLLDSVAEQAVKFKHLDWLGLLERSPTPASTLFGIPYDRPVVGYGRRTINTLRLWAAATPDYFDFQEFSEAAGGRAAAPNGFSPPESPSMTVSASSRKNSGVSSANATS